MIPPKPPVSKALYCEGRGKSTKDLCNRGDTTLECLEWSKAVETDFA